MMNAFEALKKACHESVNSTRSNLPDFDRKQLQDSIDAGDKRMLMSYGPMMSEIKKHTDLTCSAIAYRLSKDDRVICHTAGRGTCRRWWIAGYQEEIVNGEG